MTSASSATSHMSILVRAVRHAGVRAAVCIAAKPSPASFRRMSSLDGSKTVGNLKDAFAGTATCLQGFPFVGDRVLCRPHTRAHLFAARKRRALPTLIGGSLQASVWRRCDTSTWRSKPTWKALQMPLPCCVLLRSRRRTTRSVTWSSCRRPATRYPVSPLVSHDGSDADAVRLNSTYQPYRPSNTPADRLSNPSHTPTGRGVQCYRAA